MIEKHSFLRKLHLAIDLSVTALSFFIAYYLRSSADLPLRPVYSMSHYLFLLYSILPLWGVLLFYNKNYQSIRTKSLFYIMGSILKTVLVGGFVLMGLLFVFKIQMISRAFIFLFLLINFLLLTGEKICIFSILHYIRRKGYNCKNILIVGTGNRARGFAKTLCKHKEWGFNLLGYIDEEPQLKNRKIDGNRVIGLLNELPEILTKISVDEVIFVVPRKWIDKIEKSVLLCEKLGIKTRVAADFYIHKIAKTSLEQFHDFPLLTFNPTPHYSEGSIVLKRAIDILLTLLFLIFNAPLFLIVSLAVKLTSPGSVFFKQERCGLNGRKFNLLKFRTMVKDAELLKEKLQGLNEVSGPVFKMKKDPRITPAGMFLRKFSLDELPQFINVLKGDMSIVGPRPPIPSEVENYDLWQRRRLSVRPGITCLWQVNGRNNVNFEKWMKMDLEYIDKWDLLLDLKIALKTIPAVLKGTGV